jgi:small conductance mechanosensitive channel
VLPSLRDVLQSIADFLNLDSKLVARGAVRIVTIWVIAWLAHRAIKLMAHRILVAVSDGDDSTMTLREKRGQTVAQLLRSVGRVVIIVVAALMTLNVFIEITPILAGAGILGLAISFGAQSLVKDIISGFFILLENQFALGDVIEAGGKSGVVEKMTLRLVQLRDLEGVLHTVPNGEIKVVSNRTRGWARAVVDVGVSYQTDLNRALAIFRDEAARFSADAAWKHRLDGPLEVPGIEQISENAVVIRTLLRTAPGLQWDAGREYRRRLFLRLNAERIEIPYPQRTIHLRPEGVLAPDGAVTPAAVPARDARPEVKA